MSRAPRAEGAASRERWEAVLGIVDPRLGLSLRRAAGAFGASAAADRIRLEAAPLVVLVGHRAAGKSGLLPVLGPLLGRPTLDLDAELERRHGRPLRAWVAEDPPGFRRAEAATFQALPAGSLVAVGGGFLSAHPQLLEGHLPVLVPVSFETYRERLLEDATRPRLRPEVPLEEEIAAVHREREAAHARVATWPLARLLALVLPEAGP